MVSRKGRKNESAPGRAAGGGRTRICGVALSKQEDACDSPGHVNHCTRIARPGQWRRYAVLNMSDATRRPPGRGRGTNSGGRRRSTSPSSKGSRSDQFDDGPARTGNLTTMNALPAVEAPTGFADLGVPKRIDDGLAACGFAQPFAIQTEAVPVAMKGRDVCGRAQTGSGKTLAFGVSMLARITDTAKSRRPLGLVLVPTRELAVQVAEVLEPIAAHAGMKVLAVYGGASRHTQIEALNKGVELVVATPLRLIDLVKSDEVVLSDTQIVCLDEADRMADDGFTPQVEWILRHCTGRSQTMLFSATLDGDVGHLIRHYLTDPIEVAIDDATDTVGTMHHLFLAVHHMDKDKVIAAIAQGIPKVLVFCQTKRNCDRVTANLADLWRFRRFMATCHKRRANVRSNDLRKASS